MFSVSHRSTLPLVFLFASSATAWAELPVPGNLPPVVAFTSGGCIHVATRAPGDGFLTIHTHKRPYIRGEFVASRETAYDFETENIPIQVFHWRFNSGCYWFEGGYDVHALFCHFSFRQYDEGDLKLHLVKQEGREVPREVAGFVPLLVRCTSWFVEPAMVKSVRLWARLKEKTKKEDFELQKLAVNVFAYDLVPTGESTAVAFLLVEKRMTVYRGRVAREKRVKEELAPDWSRRERFAAPFQEPFHAFLDGETYYFVTASGAAFAAPKPEKGQKRQVVPLGGKDLKPVTAILSDVDSGKTFLFTAPAKEGEEGGTYLPLSLPARPVHFDFKGIQRSKDKEPLRTVLDRASVLIRDKQITMPKREPK